MPRLVNKELSEIVDQLSSYKEKVSESFYEQYKTALVLSKTINLRGKAGDALKQYINVSHINLTQKMINVADELLQAAEKVKTDFSEYESFANGVVGSGTLDKVRDQMKRTNEQFSDIDEQAGQLMYRAEEYISTTSLSSGKVTDAYSNIYDQLEKTKSGLEDTDSSLTASLETVANRVGDLQTQIFALSETYRDDHGIKYSKLNEIPSQKWYSAEANHAFKDMQEDDPFSYHAGHASMAEGQWVAGTSDTNYITASGYAVGAEGEFTKSGRLFSKENPLTMEGAGSAAVLSGDVQGETLWGYGNLDASGQILDAEGNMYVGKDGFDLDGKVAVAEAEGTAMVGTDNFNGYVTGHVEALSADAHARFKLPEDQDGDVNIGLGAKAQGATAGFETGLSIFEVDSPGGEMKDGKNPEKKSLLGINGGVNVGPQVGAGADFSSETVYSNDYFNVRANELDIDIRLGAGFKLSVAVPSIQLKWPW